MNYKYTLDKSSKKFICPSCGKKRLVKYLSTETQNYLNGSGRCDRESKCGYHVSPKGNTLSVIQNKSVTLEVQPFATFHNQMVIGMYGRGYSNNNFRNYLLLFFSATEVAHAIKKYFIGTSNHWNGATIFWQVDEQLNVCAGKVMLYDNKTGKRVKKPYPHINWMHKVLHINEFVLQQCLFGIHNLCDYLRGSTVCIVESEKTAVIMSLIFPAYLWLATGSKANLKAKLLRPLKHYKIIVFPDKTEFKDWNTKVEYLQALGFMIRCSSLLEGSDLEEGNDLVDMLLAS